MLLGISVVKNEADIIETMVRLNLRFLDHLHLFDNGSTDGTGEILSQLAREMDAVSFEVDARTGHPQTGILNDFLNGRVASYAPTHVIPLDGDEILCGDPSAFRSECDAVNVPLLLKWRTYVPREDDDQNQENPVRRIVHRRLSERPQFSKSTMPKSLLGLAQLGPGSHIVLQDGKKVSSKKSESAHIAHFPVRHPEQVVGKALVGHWGLKLRSAPKSEGEQWRNISQEILEKGELSQESFFRVAEGYAARGRAKLTKDPITLPTRFKIKYPNANPSNALQKIAEFVETLVDKASGDASSDRTRHVTTDEVKRIVGTRGLPRPAKLVRAVITGKTVEFCVTHPQDVIQKHHLQGQFYEAEELEIIRNNFPEGGTFVDIGANVGNHSLFCALFLNPERVILAEPNPVAIRTLVANVQINGLEDICDTSRLGVGIGAKTMKGAAVSWRSRGWEKSNLGGAQLRETGGDLTVLRGDEFMGEDRADFIKIDVEGMEISVLEGLSSTIERDRPILFVEVDNENSSEMEKWLNRSNYQVSERFSRYSSNCNFLCRPV